jgi:hypothetical protein
MRITELPCFFPLRFDKKNDSFLFLSKYKRRAWANTQSIFLKAHWIY